MSRMLFLNLPVRDLPASKEFFGRLGFAFEAAFNDDTCGCMVINESTFAMLLTEARFKDFIDGDICDTARSVEMLACVSAESRAEVDSLVTAAVDAGGTLHREPMDEDSMYSRAFRDLDGHVWEVMWMDPAAVPQQ